MIPVRMRQLETLVLAGLRFAGSASRANHRRLGSVVHW